MFNDSQYAGAQAAYRAAQLRDSRGGVVRRRTRIPFVGRGTRVNRRTR